MASRRSRRPPSLNLSLSSRETSPTNRTTPSPEPDTDDERMSNEYNNNRPLSVAYPSGPYCVKRPSLSEVLSNTAGAPFTLAAFMAFLSQNHCLETLEFTMDATRYRKFFNALVPSEDNKSAAAEEGREYVRMLWRKILDAYIVPNGPREVNLPCTVRNHILHLPSSRTPPPPESLDSAVNIVYELMQESVLMPFISDCQQQAACAGHYPWGEAAQSDENLCMRGSLDERFLRRRGKRDPSPPPQLDFVSNSYSSGSTRQQQRSASPFSASLGWHRHSAGTGPGSWGSGSGDSLVMMVEDSGTSSPGSFANPMTPPTTPPTCESMLPTSTTSSPKHKTTVDKAAKGWKNMTGNLGGRFGWSKKKGPQIWSENGSF